MTDARIERLERLLDELPKGLGAVVAALAALQVEVRHVQESQAALEATVQRDLTFAVELRVTMQGVTDRFDAHVSVATLQKSEMDVRLAKLDAAVFGDDGKVAKLENRVDRKLDTPTVAAATAVVLAGANLLDHWLRWLPRTP